MSDPDMRVLAEKLLAACKQAADVLPLCKAVGNKVKYYSFDPLKRLQINLEKVIAEAEKALEETK